MVEFPVDPLIKPKDSIALFKNKNQNIKIINRLFKKVNRLANPLLIVLFTSTIHIWVYNRESCILL